MPKTCSVGSLFCSANKHKNPDINFFVFPANPDRRKLWAKAIKRAYVRCDGSVDKTRIWEPRGRSVYVCSRHFITGHPNMDRNHPDYAPSVFQEDNSGLCNNTKHLKRLDRYIRAKNRKDSTSTSQNETQLQTESSIHTSQKDCTSITPTQTVPSLHSTIEDSGNVQTHPLTSLSHQGLASSSGNTTFTSMDTDPLNVPSLPQSFLNFPLCANSVCNNDEKCHMLMGIKWGVFEEIYNLLFKERKCKSSIPFIDQLLLTLVKLRHNLSFDLLAYLKGIPKSTLISYFWTNIDLLYCKLHFLIKWQDRENIFKIIPPIFKSKFPRLTSIIDCFEIFIDAPKNLKARAKCYSNYKKHTTVKVFISCSPLGYINLISPCWGGRVSDVEIVRKSGFISRNFHQPGDQILADRGFNLIDDFATECGAELLIPSFTKNKKQLSAEEVEKSRKISSVRIHIERVIGLIKNRYKILSGMLPIRMIQNLKDEASEAKLSSFDKIVKVCAVLVNLSESIVYKE